MFDNNDEQLQKYFTPYCRSTPVLCPSGIRGAFDEIAVDIPFVFRHRDQFYMLYTGFDGKGYRSALAVSDDLIKWTHKAVILERKEGSGSWDAAGGAATWILKKNNSIWKVPELLKLDGRYWMVYHSYPQAGYEAGPAEIGIAWTEDEELLDWHFPDKPVFRWEDGEDWERGGLYKAALLYEKGEFLLFYNAKNEKKVWTEQTGLARSGDMMNWTRCKENPVLRIDEARWDCRFVSDPCIVKDGDIWLNFYFGFGRQERDGHAHAKEGLALSYDLIHWEKVKDPIIENVPSPGFGSGHIHKASIVFWEGTLYHFFCGTRPAMSREPQQWGEYRAIGLAASKPV